MWSAEVACVAEKNLRGQVGFRVQVRGSAFRVQGFPMIPNVSGWITSHYDSIEFTCAGARTVVRAIIRATRLIAGPQ